MSNRTPGRSEKEDVTSTDNQINQGTNRQVTTSICAVINGNESLEVWCFNDAVIKMMALNSFSPHVLNVA